jgi:hypothetical protein
MQIARLSIRWYALLVMFIIAGRALAQPVPAKTKTEPPALAALHAIDDYEASLEALLPYFATATFEMREKASPYKAQKRRAELALDRVSDRDLHRDLNTLLDDTRGLWIQSTGLVADPKDKGLSKAIAEFHSDRNLVSTEIATGKRGLLHDAITKRYHK